MQPKTQKNTGVVSAVYSGWRDKPPRRGHNCLSNLGLNTGPAQLKTLYGASTTSRTAQRLIGVAKEWCSDLLRLSATQTTAGQIFAAEKAKWESSWCFADPEYQDRPATLIDWQNCRSRDMGEGVDEATLAIFCGSQ